MIKAFFWDILESSFLDFFKASKRDVNAMNSIPKVSRAALCLTIQNSCFFTTQLNSRKRRERRKVPFQQYFWPNKEKFIKDQVASSSSSESSHTISTSSLKDRHPLIPRKMTPDDHHQESTHSACKQYTLKWYNCFLLYFDPNEPKY